MTQNNGKLAGMMLGTANINKKKIKIRKNVYFLFFLWYNNLGYSTYERGVPWNTLNIYYFQY